jgi:hypothetical protein
MAEEQTQLEKLKLKILFDEDIFDTEELYEIVLQGLLEDSKNIALANLYPFLDWSEMELPKKYYNWQIRASVELYKYDQYMGIKSYSENGLSFSRDSDGLSTALLDELVPKAGIPQRIEEKEEENG